MGMHRSLELGDVFIGLPQLFWVGRCILSSPGSKEFKRSVVH